MLLETKVMPANGYCFGVSPRLVEALSYYHPRARLLLPPVDGIYFVDEGVKNTAREDGVLQVAFVGRLDEGKGIYRVLELFSRLGEDSRLDLVICGMHWPDDPSGVSAHLDLELQDHIRYIHHEFGRFSDEVDGKVAAVVRDSDLLVLPYVDTSSTIDAPLVLLEAMAAKTAVLTPPVGALESIYGRSATYLSLSDPVDSAEDLIRRSEDWLPAERRRIAARVACRPFDTDSIVDALIETLAEGSTESWS